MSLSLPPEEEAVTATGVVRWSASQPRRSSWYPLGLEWLPLEEAAHHRLHHFLSHHAAIASTHAPPIRSLIPHNLTIQRITVWLGVAATLFILVWFGFLQRENRQLAETVKRREIAIHQLEQRGQLLQQELGAAKTRLASAAREVNQLDTQSRSLHGEVQKLHQEVERVQVSYARVREEREQLMQRVLDLEQERARLAKKLSSIPELRLAIREAVEARKQAEQSQRRLLAEAKRESDRQQLAAGNRGYLVREGRPTVTGSTVWIRVHEPESLISK